jgi:hypothetical protein
MVVSWAYIEWDLMEFNGDFMGFSLIFGLGVEHCDLMVVKSTYHGKPTAE